MRNELPILRVGGRELSISRYPESGETTSLLFAIDADSFAGLPDGSEATLRYGESPALPVGRLNKSLLRQ